MKIENIPVENQHTFTRIHMTNNCQEKLVHVWVCVVCVCVSHVFVCLCMCVCVCY